MDRVIVFDGVCVLCSRWIGFVLKRDRVGHFKFAAMQTPTGRDLLTRHDIDPDDPLSFLLLENGKGYTDTDAIVSRFIRDPLYRWVARHRYRLFGQRPSCLLPSADVADRFLH
jgi:predicted DCC family thiol-disulfide oxidoreductase YuxK